MKKVLNFLDVWGIRVVFILTLIVFLKTCTTNSKIESVSKKVDGLTKDNDSLRNEITILTKQLRKEIKIEGLKSEKRMIQSTDRKILDVNRQSEIDKEISNLDK